MNSFTLGLDPIFFFKALSLLHYGMFSLYTSPVSGASLFFCALQAVLCGVPCIAS